MYSKGQQNAYMHNVRIECMVGYSEALCTHLHIHAHTQTNVYSDMYCQCNCAVCTQHSQQIY